MDVNAIAGLAGSMAEAPAKAETPEAVGKQVEAMFARMLLKEVRKAMPKDGLMGGREVEMFTDMLDEQLAERIAEGGSLGLADQISQMLGGDPITPSVPLAPHVHRHPNPDVHGTPTTGRVTSSFGHRSDPFHGRRKFHSGVDIGAPKGTPITALQPGRVTHAGPAGTYGNLIVVDHGDGVETRYAHAHGVDVQVGDQVQAGARLGTVGSTGRSTGPHLHFEVRRNGRALDPMPFLRRGDPVSAQSTPDPGR